MEGTKNRIKPNVFIGTVKTVSLLKRGLHLLFVLFLVLQSPVVFAQNNHKQEIYNWYIKGNMQDWKGIIDQMEKTNSDDAEYILKLTEYHYGYIAWCIGNDKKKEAKRYLELADKNLEKLEKNPQLTSDVHAFKAAFYGFRIGIKPISAPFNGSKSLNNAETALKTDSTNYRANFEMGNIWYHMPKMFGGSDKKALRYYSKALLNIQKKKPEELNHNWIYLNMLAITGQAEQKLGNKENARLIYEKALAIEPNFIWVKRGLLPSLNKN